jgi:hypothetical protein
VISSISISFFLSSLEEVSTAVTLVLPILLVGVVIFSTEHYGMNIEL